jgi:hypothetical protein
MRDGGSGTEFLAVTLACLLAPENRPDGFTVWLTFALSPAAPEPSQPRNRRVVK